jgi:hypothetical protein
VRRLKEKCTRIQNRSRGQRSIQNNTIEIVKHSLDVDIGSMNFANAYSTYSRTTILQFDTKITDGIVFRLTHAYDKTEFLMLVEKFCI